MLIWYFSNNLDVYDYVGKLPEQLFSVQLFSNPVDKISFLLKFNEVRISEWNICMTERKVIQEGGVGWGDRTNNVISKTVQGQWLL